jgi:hypothetical protein
MISFSIFAILESFILAFIIDDFIKFACIFDIFFSKYSSSCNFDFLRRFAPAAAASSSSESYLSSSSLEKESCLVAPAWLELSAYSCSLTN